MTITKDKSPASYEEQTTIIRPPLPGVESPTIPDDGELTRKSILPKLDALAEEAGYSPDGDRDLAIRRIQTNIETTVLPLLTRLETENNERKRQIISLIRQNLTDIMSPFLQNLRLISIRLTPRETQVCSMVRQGLSCKEIAALLHVSEQTVLKFRKNIRKKLGIAGEKVNLSSYLSELSLYESVSGP